MSCSPSFLFLADRRGTQCGLRLLYSTCFNYWLVLCSERVFWYLGCKQCLFKLLFPLYHLKPVWTHSSDINKHFCPKHFCSWNIFSVFIFLLFSVSPRDGGARKVSVYHWARKAQTNSSSTNMWFADLIFVPTKLWNVSPAYKRLKLNYFQKPISRKSSSLRVAHLLVYFLSSDFPLNFLLQFSFNPKPIH